jgi:Nif-specific regulatory protein
MTRQVWRRPGKIASLQDIQREHIVATLHSINRNKSQAAGILGIERSTLDRKIRRTIGWS